MPKFVSCDRLDGRTIYVNLDQVLSVEPLENGNARLTFANGKTMQVVTPAETITSS